MTAEVTTYGETMALMTAAEIGPLRSSRSFSLSYAGAESNVAVGLSRLGVAASWWGRLGNDEFGHMIYNGLRGEGVDVSGVTWSEGEPTGLMIKERRTGDTVRVAYYRKGSAASRMGADHIDADAIKGARVLHVSGITAAISERSAACLWLACDLARKSDVAVSVDLNFRSRLWTADEAVPVLRELVGRADIVFATDSEAAMLLGDASPDALAARLAALGPREAVVKMGSKGAVSVAEGRVVTQAARPVQVVDPVGAGDAFAAGYLAAWLADEQPEDRLWTACEMGRYAVAVQGDCEGLPTREELDAVAASTDVAR